MGESSVCIQKAKEELRTAQRIEDSQGRDGTDMFSDKRKGIFAFISNKDEEAKKIYLAYKERRDIEQCFVYLKNSVDIGASSQRSNEKHAGMDIYKPCKPFVFLFPRISNQKKWDEQ